MTTDEEVITDETMTTVKTVTTSLSGGEHPTSDNNKTTTITAATVTAFIAVVIIVMALLSCVLCKWILMYKKHQMRETCLTTYMINTPCMVGHKGHSPLHKISGPSINSSVALSHNMSLSNQSKVIFCPPCSSSKKSNSTKMYNHYDQRHSPLLNNHFTNPQKHHSLRNAKAPNGAVTDYQQQVLNQNKPPTEESRGLITITYYLDNDILSPIIVNQIEQEGLTLGLFKEKIFQRTGEFK